MHICTWLFAQGVVVPHHKVKNTYNRKKLEILLKMTSPGSSNERAHCRPVSITKLPNLHRQTQQALVAEKTDVNSFKRSQNIPDSALIYQSPRLHLRTEPIPKTPITPFQQHEQSAERQPHPSLPTSPTLPPPLPQYSLLPQPQTQIPHSTAPRPNLGPHLAPLTSLSTSRPPLARHSYLPRRAANSWHGVWTRRGEARRERAQAKEAKTATSPGEGVRGDF